MSYKINHLKNAGFLQAFVIGDKADNLFMIETIGLYHLSMNTLLKIHNRHKSLKQKTKQKAVKALVFSAIILAGANTIRLNHIDQKNSSNQLAQNQILKEDEIHFKTSSVAKMISKLKPKFSAKKRIDVATLINKTAKRYHINPKILIAIIDTESDFNKDMISPTGDLSMAQINVEIWNKEFARLKKPLINEERLKKDELYSLEVMGQILTILKKRFSHKDRNWYARYHSGNKKFKKEYLVKVDTRLALMN